MRFLCRQTGRQESNLENFNALVAPLHYVANNCPIVRVDRSIQMLCMCLQSNHGFAGSFTPICKIDGTRGSDLCIVKNK